MLATAESYAERLLDYRLIDGLADDDALFALTEPAATQDVRWEPDAARFLLDESGGYPYFLKAVDVRGSRVRSGCRSVRSPGCTRPGRPAHDRHVRGGRPERRDTADNR